MGARADRLNRILLTLLGLVLLVAGTGTLVAGSGVLGRDVAEQRVLHPDTGSFIERNAGWLWPAVALVAVLLALLALRWLLLQLRSDRIEEVDLTRTRRSGETHVDTAALTSALVDAVQDCPGVDGATVRLVRARGREQLLMHVRLADRADIAATRTQLAEGPIEQLLQVMGEQAPAVVVELEPSTRGSSRTVV